MLVWISPWSICQRDDFWQYHFREMIPAYCIIGKYLKNLTWVLTKVMWVKLDQQKYSITVNDCVHMKSQVIVLWLQFWVYWPCSITDYIRLYTIYQKLCAPLHIKHNGNVGVLLLVSGMMCPCWEDLVYLEVSSQTLFILLKTFI